jgi:hypothetical protein
MRGSVYIFAVLMLNISIALLHGDDLPGTVLQTAHTLRHNRALLESLPAYTCLETIAREQKGPKKRKSRALDIVQVDVGVGRNQEIYSWPGEEVFSSSDLAALIGQGFSETGSFNSFASNLFVSNGGIVRPAGEQVLQGRDTIHFTYSIPSLASNWDIDWLGSRGVVGESGEFWVDKQSLTLVRLEAAAQNFPPNLPLKAMTVVIKYEALTSEGKTVLVPSSAEAVAVELNGTMHRNVIGFSQCHVFKAESRMSSSPETLAKAVEGYETHRDAMPAGLDLSITLDTEIRGDTVKVGDAVIAHLNKAVKISKEGMIPRGAIVNGRVRELREIPDLPNTCQIGVELNEIDWPGHVGIFFGQAVNLQQITGLSTFISRGTIRTINAPGGLLTNSATENIWPTDMPGVAMFFLSGPRVIPKGFRMTWRTRATKHL